MEAAVPAEEALVLVEYGFEYRAKDGTLVSIKPNERYVLLKRTNHHWWHVKRSGDTRPFYIPAQYVKELPPIATPAPLDPPPPGHAGTDPAVLVPQQPPGYEYRFIGATEAEEPVGGCSVPRRDSPPVLSSFRAPPARSTHPAEPVQHSHSLDDLARVMPAPRGATAMGSRGDLLGHTHPLGKSRSETLYTPSKDRDTARRWPGSSHATQAHKEPEEPPAPIYLNIQELREEAAAARSAPEEAGSSSLDWETHTDTESGHLFYYNPVTGETTWDCPFGQAEDGVSPAASPASSLTHSPEFPAWEQYVDEASGQAFFYNSVTGETSWDPPPRGDGGSSQDMYPGVTRYSSMEQRPPTPETDYPDLSPDELEGYPEEDYSPVGSYDQGAAFYLSPRRPEELGSPPGWYRHSHPEGAVFYPEHFASDTVPAGGRHKRASSGSSQDSGLFAWHSAAPPALGLKEEKFKSLEKAGVLNRTKTVDRGKRLRKNWSSSWTVLEGRILTFFKDSKHSAAGALRHPSTLTTPEHTVELSGATLAWASKDKSSKKHVLELKTREGSEFLIQHDSEQIITAWQKAISDSISRLGTDLPGEEDAESGAEFGSREKLGSSEEKRAVAGQVLGSASGESDSSKVRNKLRKFLQRRPTLQSLRERGYIKDPVFGCSLQALCERERGTVPRFVLQCIQTVERRGLDIDGLYRVSGNLATVQRLRYKVEHDEHLDLDDGRWEDIHVVTGALKLFFRELLEPLVPFSHFDKFITAIKLQDLSRRGRCIRDLVFSLPPAHHDTMKVLFRHLCRVIEYREENRMSVQSIAIVFGPTLLRPASEEGNMAMHMVFQNQVVEHILNQYSYIFPDG
ncbi:LOW QUALITY PROTEIN: rho GTPase-activating protein 27 [Falco peregrinus]|uniref:LOW QUALITY PROTEIN: rho GTPase-activating protein 27 n=1 Tax=Falco peregrinus TaxID=8954 RepID=UPI002479E7C6|nr:LOW QUALITY PROTEIN: rho GTPase-activating protein 27 [Falco peregrinus]